MKFTRKEYVERLIPQGKSIEEFIKKEIQPYLFEEVVINFGDIVRRGRYNEIKEHEFSLYVRNDSIVGTCGGLSLLFKMEDYQKGVCGWVDIYNDYSYGGDFIYELCLNWQSIKRELLNNINSQKASRNNVFNNFRI